MVESEREQQRIFLQRVQVNIIADIRYVGDRVLIIEPGDPLGERIATFSFELQGSGGAWYPHHVGYLEDEGGNRVAAIAILDAKAPPGDYSIEVEIR